MILRNRQFQIHLIASMVLALVAGLATAQPYQESPELASRVAAGELPAVAERLPTNPLVQQMESIGRYGGTLRIVSFRDDLDYQKPELFDYAGGFGSEVLPGLYESWEWNEARTALTVHIRDGVRWSDGEIFNADDIVWWWEFIMTYSPNPERPASAYYAAYEYAGEFLTLERIDDLTVRYSFPGPNPSFLHAMTFGIFGPEVYPPQWLWPVHPENQGFADDDVESRIAQFSDHLTLDRAGPIAQHQIPGYPTLHPFVTESREEGIGSVYLRNPYYWQVDTDGNQLPYIDRIEVTQVPEMDLRVAKLIAGEIDVANVPNSNSWRLLDLPLLLDNQERGGYRVIFQEAARAWAPQLYFNQTGPQRNRLYLQNRDFRIALSIAIDREEINELLYQGLGVPWNVAPRPGMIGFVEGLGTLFTEYDPDAANATLDGMGLSERDADGFRIGPDGRRVSLVLAHDEGAEPIETVELIAEYWNEIGLEVLIREIRGWFEIKDEYPNWDILAYYAEAGGFHLVRPDKWLPGPLLGGLYGTEGWNRWWLSDGRNGEEPPPYVKEFFDLYVNSVLLSATEEEMTAKFEDLMRLSVHNFWTTPTLYLPVVNTVHTDLMNVREDVSLEASNVWARLQTWWWDR